MIEICAAAALSFVERRRKESGCTYICVMPVGPKVWKSSQLDSSAMVRGERTEAA